jgi:hypothetical protein
LKGISAEDHAALPRGLIQARRDTRSGEIGRSSRDAQRAPRSGKESPQAEAVDGEAFDKVTRTGARALRLNMLWAFFDLCACCVRG